MDRPEDAGGDALLHDAADGAGHGGERRQRVAIEMGAAFGDLAEHDGGEERVLLEEAGKGGDGAVDLLGGRAAAGGNGLQRLDGEREHLPQQDAIEPLLALEVVVEHRLVDAGAAGDAIDAGAGEAVLGELEGGGGQDAVRRDARGAAHMKLTG